MVNQVAHLSLPVVPEPVVMVDISGWNPAFHSENKQPLEAQEFPTIKFRFMMIWESNQLNTCGVFWDNVSLRRSTEHVVKSAPVYLGKPIALNALWVGFHCYSIKVQLFEGLCHPSTTDQSRKAFWSPTICTWSSQLQWKQILVQFFLSFIHFLIDKPAVIWTSF